MATRQDRLLELLADRALVGLDPREQIELAELLIEIPGVDAEHFERAAAAVTLANLGRLEPLPEKLAARIEADALHGLSSSLHATSHDRTEIDPVIDLDPAQVASERSVPPPHLARTHVMPDRPRAPVTAPASGPAPAPAPAPIPLPVRAPSRAFAFAGWIAAAACFLLAIGALVYRSTPTQSPAQPSARVAESPSALREKLLASAGTARAEWSATKDPAGKAVTGDVVWNAAEQRGTMRFRGLAKNDPTRSQYQLWIFDKTRDDKYPVDGGVFDVDSETDDVVVAIKATLPVATPVLFAVTIEKPGGVVVSKRERIVVTAKLPAG